MTRAIDLFRQTPVTLPAGVILDAHNEFVRLIAEADHRDMRGDRLAAAWRPHWVNLRTKLGEAGIAEQAAAGPDDQTAFKGAIVPVYRLKSAVYVLERAAQIGGPHSALREDARQLVDQLNPFIDKALGIPDPELNELTQKIKGAALRCDCCIDNSEGEHEAELNELLEQVVGLFNRVRGL